MRRCIEGQSGPRRLGLGHRRRDRHNSHRVGGRTARHGDQQRRRTDRAGAAVDLRGAGCAAGDPDGLPVRHESGHDLAPGLEAQGLEDGGGQAGGQPGTRRTDRRTARRPLGRVPVRARAPGRRRPAQRLRGPGSEPGGLRPGTRGQRARLSGAAEGAAAKKTAKGAGPPRKRAASSSASSSSSSSRTLKAKFPGRCRCGRSYTAGETIAKNADGWGHPGCRTEA